MIFKHIRMPRIRRLSNSHRFKQPKYKGSDPNKWRKFYGCKEWKKLREAKLMEQPLCEMCLENDIIRAATDVHHVYEFSNGATEEDQWKLFLDYTNLMSLCKQCHVRIHANKRNK